MKLNTMGEKLEKLSKKIIEKGEINSISKFINGLRFNSNQNQVNKDFAELLITIINSSEKKITKKQSDFGINWLKEKYIRKDGQPRKQLENDFGHFDVSISPSDAFSIINNFKMFTFIGFTGRWDSYSRQYVDLNPVYKVISKTGESFSYTAYFHGNTIINPEIITTVF